MLLLHQIGSLKIGEVVRYTVTYTPSQDRILPSPEKLFVRIRNTSAIALRAAFVHGPYTLSAAAYPSNYNPNVKFENPRRYGVPEFEPMVKAGGSWECALVVPDDIRQSAGVGNHGNFGSGPQHDEESASWIIEISSQVVFSASAAVGYEVVVARDQKSLNLSSSLPIVSGQSQVPQPGKVSDLQQSIGAKDGHHPAQPKGVFSRAIKIKVEDTASLWNTPRLPGWDDAGKERITARNTADRPVESVVNKESKGDDKEEPPCKKKKVHLVILTHGLHSNLGADMLYMKESIDSAAAQAKEDANIRRAKERAEKSSSETSGTEDDKPEENGEQEEEEDEDVIVRGFSGNATKTERGIKYLGKRLARYVLSLTYPDQPFIPIGKGMGEGLHEGANIRDTNDEHLKKAHKHSDLVSDTIPEHLEKHKRPYQITSISFVGHSLGGLVQTYAVAYIQKHSPEFFNLIRPINFIALASPFLGLSNENPLYVKFALDFGLVGRTGKDLGLTWRAPTIARNGWGALVSNLGETAHKKVYGESQPESKPLLRILPTGPAHIALKKFRNRTVYSNVVNDGIVPLRTSCLLFLDWQGLGRVEKARRDAGLVETMVGFGWAELTGTNITPRPKSKFTSDSSQNLDSGASTPRVEGREVPQPDEDTMHEDDRASIHSVPRSYTEARSPDASTEPSTQGPLAGFFNLFKSNEPPKPQHVSSKQKFILRRGQTIHFNEGSSTPSSSTSDVSNSKASKVTSGHELEEDSNAVTAPPKTTIFESAGDLLNPTMPDVDYLIDPSKRPRTIFHDRVYHPSDIPSPPLKKRTTSSMIRRKTFKSQPTTDSASSSPHATFTHQDSSISAKDYDDTANTNPDKHPDEVVDGSNMKVEEKIARGYHRGLAWRKVLVKLEPDAHNNIVVRRMFANAHGWPVMKHMVDVHFSDSAVSRMRTEDEFLGERALPINQPPDEHGAETKIAEPVLIPETKDKEEHIDQVDLEATAEARDELGELPRSINEEAGGSSTGHTSPHHESVTWSERDWSDSENDTDAESGNEKKKGEQSNSKTVKVESPSSPSWNWAEKIVGKGSTQPKSPTTNTRP